MVLALALLGGGILWQNGLWDPFKLLGLERPTKEGLNKIFVKRKVLKKDIEKKEKAISLKPGAKGSPSSPLIARASTDIVSTGSSEDRERLSNKTGQNKAVAIPAKTKISPWKLRVGTATSPPSSPPVARERVSSEKPLSSEKILSYPYSLYLGSYGTLKRAKKAVSMYGKKGLSPAYWVRVELSKGVWYRIFTGYFEDREQAERFKQEHGLKEATVRKIKYANLIGSYTSSKKLENQILLLKKFGNSPYIIEDHDGKFRLFVGAFATKKGAETQYRDLKSRGIQNEVVRR
jgi:cell division septation protein DedD